MPNCFDLSHLLTGPEQKIIVTPEKWRWISSVRKPDVQPVDRPDHLRWARNHCHAPPWRELCLGLAGSTVFVFKDKVYPIRPGTVVLFNNHERHVRDKAKVHRNFRHLWLHVSNRHAVTSNLNELDALGKRTNTVMKTMAEARASILMDVWDCCSVESPNPVHWALLRTLIASLLLEAVCGGPSSPQVAHPHEAIVEAVCSHIEKNLTGDLSLRRLSEVAGYSPYFFHRLFLRYKEKPLHQYIVEARIQRAKELLLKGYSVKAVSEEIGSPSPSYFSRFFRKHTRFTPSYWTETHREEG